MIGRKIIALAIIILCIIAACNKSDKMFSVLSASETGIDFKNILNDDGSLSILNYIYYYNGGGVAVGDINNDGLPDIYFTANSKGHNNLYLNKGNFKFEDITEKAGVAGTSDWCTGVTMADVNGDGWLDIYVCAVANMHGLRGHNELFINNGNNAFTESAALYGLNFSGYSTQSAFFDYDHDGDLDCFLINQSEHPNQNIHDTSFRHGFDVNSGERLFRNNLNQGSKKFTDVSSEAGIYQSSVCYGLGLSIGDLNNDGWDDIYVGNDFHENDYYYINKGNGTFNERGAQHFKHYSRYSMGNDIADYNNDGQLDVITADMLPGEEKTLKTYGNDEHLQTYLQKITDNGYQNQYSRNCLQRNNGDGVSFSDVGLISGISATDWSWSPLFADFDNDGNKDLFISSGIVKRPLDLDFIKFFSDIKDPRVFGSPQEFQQTLIKKMPDGASHPYFFKGDGNLHFKDVSEDWRTNEIKGYFNGAAYADLDNDGRVDVVINSLQAPALILKNNSPKKSFISIAFKGDDMNKFGIGAKAYLFTNGKIQYRQLMLTRGFMSSSDTRLHFGLDSLNTVDSLLIVWPNQKYQVIKSLAANKQIMVDERNAVSGFDYKHFFPAKKELFQNISDEVNIGWKHEENNFNDFNNQYLMPHEESARGPAIAVADVNNDGKDDIFLCGAKGQQGCLMAQTSNGNFQKTNTATFAQNISSDQTSAIFFDANNDGFPDLYVASGGNEIQDGNKALSDHLYINDGKGNFKEDSNALPAILTNKSCIAVADINHDGSKDIFVGTLADAAKYGNAETSYLLLNDGKGHFTKAEKSIISLEQIGMITTAAFTDINRDGWTDLIVTGEWMPVKIFMNQKGKFKEEDIANSNGLWQTIYPADVNNDGYIDFLAGNWGLNSKLFAQTNAPLKLYINDFNKNGSMQQVIAYTIDGKEYPFYGKDQLELIIPQLKKQHLTYDEVAGKTLQYMFGNLFTGSLELKAETLASSCFMNDGKGHFIKKDLPAELQLAPIFAFTSFSSNNNTHFLAVGNFYGVPPYEGRYDAMSPTLFTYDTAKHNFMYESNLPKVNSECRDLKWIRSKNNQKLLAIAANNDSLLILQQRP